jgi:hypothetical protein
MSRMARDGIAIGGVVGSDLQISFLAALRSGRLKTSTKGPGGLFDKREAI